MSVGARRVVLFYAEDTVQIELTKTEADQLVQLIDLAVKAAGLGAARVAADLTDRIVAAAKAETQEEPGGDQTVD